VKYINWGIIGLGQVASQFAGSFKLTHKAKLLSIASKSIDRLKKFKREFKVAENYCYNNYQNLIDNNEIDIVYIALPTSMHFEWIVKCLEAGKKVLIEKPATMNAVEIKKIKEKYLHKEIFLIEALMYMYHPQIKKTIELIKQKEIGDLISMKTNFGNDILSKKSFFGFKRIKKIDIKKRIFNKNLGGGVILDLGCYPVSFSTLIASQISKIDYGKIKIKNIDNDLRLDGVEVDASAKIIFENNFESSVAASFSKNLGKKTIIFGTKGEIKLEDTWSATPAIINIKSDRKKILDMSSVENNYTHEINDISQCVLDNKIKTDFPGLTIDDIIGNMKIIDKWKHNYEK